jgi:LPXTG-motif cell wall-anchored protein
MDNSTIVRIVSGILFVVGLLFLVQRRRRKVS